MSQSIQIVVIGGGSGSTTVIRSLYKLNQPKITAITTATDSGGRSGLVRTDERDRVISIGDLFDNFIALIPEDQTKKSTTQAFRSLAEFTDGRRRNLGYAIYYGLLEKYEGDHNQVQAHLAQLLNINLLGTVVPVTKEVTNLCFNTKAGHHYQGEDLLDYYQMSRDQVDHIWLQPQVKANPDAIDAILNADYLFFAPGTLYGSLLVNFLPIGITDSLQKSSAKKILITNLVSDRNQTHNFTPQKYWKKLQEYTKLKTPFEYLVTPHLTTKLFNQTYPQIAAAYQAEHSQFLGWDKSTFKSLQAQNVTCIQAKITTITPELNRVRHDPKLLSRIWDTIIT